MPYIRIQTNEIADNKPALLKKLSAVSAVAVGKPESYIQTALDDASVMTFGGSDAPTAFVECKSIGLTDGQTAGISAALSDFCSEELSIPVDRIYIAFSGVAGKMWGWKGGTF